MKIISVLKDKDGNVLAIHDFFKRETTYQKKYRSMSWNNDPVIKKATRAEMYLGEYKKDKEPDSVWEIKQNNKGYFSMENWGGYYILQVDLPESSKRIKKLVDTFKGIKCNKDSFDNMISWISQDRDIMYSYVDPVDHVIYRAIRGNNPIEEIEGAISKLCKSIENLKK